jgi:hypothetical protein
MSNFDGETREALPASRTRGSELDAMIRLHKLSALAITGADREAILHEIVDTAINVTGAEFGALQLIDPISSALRIVAQRGFPEWWVDF